MKLTEYVLNIIDPAVRVSYRNGVPKLTPKVPLLSRLLGRPRSALQPPEENT